VTVRRGVPSTLNTPALDPVLMWDGRQPNLEAQAAGVRQRLQDLHALGRRAHGALLHDNSAKTLLDVAAHDADFFELTTDADGPGPAEPALVLTERDQADIAAYLELL
jgi:hypothetical protein